MEKRSSENIRAIIVDFDGVLLYLRNSLDESLVEIDIKYSKNKFISYPEGIDGRLWKSQAIGKMGNFLSSLLLLNLPIGIISHGNIEFVRCLISSYCDIDESDFAIIVSSEDLSGSQLLEETIISITQKMGVDIGDLMMIGSISSHIASKSAFGIQRLCLTDSISSSDLETFNTEFVVDNLSDILLIIKRGILLAEGKLPNIFLSELLSKYSVKDLSLIIGPAVGEDTAAIDIRGDETLVLKSDPITFTTDNIGYYAVLVNINDMATSGALPRWMLTTILLPPAISLYEVQKIFKEIYETCSEYGVILCGGHTEITNAVSRPVIVGTVIGTVKRKKLINKRSVKTGDYILMTKGVAIEGTVIIASEFSDLLLNYGMNDTDINDCLKFKSKLSILNEARIAWQSPGVSALHDVTEGGIATAISELSAASGYGIRIFLDDILIYNRTQIVCDLLNLDPLGLIGSGSLLICCQEENIDFLFNKMQQKNIILTIIGKITDKGGGVEAIKDGLSCKVPYFGSDEITRLYK